MSVVLLPPAGDELDEAIAYYNDQLSGLGGHFYRAFLTAINCISQAPEAWRKVGANTRRINLVRFPYLLLYVVDKEDIIITCIAHQHRNPSYYLDKN